MGDSGPAVRSVERAIDILEVLAAGEGDLGVTQIGRELGVHKATASRLLATLAGHGLVEQNAQTDKYRLGFGLVRLAGVAIGRLDLVDQARPVLRELADDTEETINLAVLSDDVVVNVDQVNGRHAVAVVDWVGRQTPAHCTSSGKVLMAHLPPEARERMLERPLARFTPATITDAARLRSELEQARTRGYASTREEYEDGLAAVAAAVFAADGGVVAAVSVAGPAFRLRPPVVARYGRRTAAAAAEISTRLGYAQPAPVGQRAARPPRERKGART
jgi:IclR family transcriptional regulator, acetate operon repressor